MIGVGIIGTGTISDKHIEAYQIFHNRCKIVALCDTIQEKAKDKKEKFHLADAKIYSELEKMLQDEAVQLVSICTPPFTHAASAICSMRKGKHVLVEKPMASSLEECDEMLQVQKEMGCCLATVAQNRYEPDHKRLKSLLTMGAAGKILFGQAESYWFRGLDYYNVWWRGTWEKEGGGCTLNHGVHQIDLLNWMLGSPQTVTAVLGNVAHDNAEIEDVSAAIFTYESGAIITMTTSLVTHGEGQRLVFQCEKASLASPWEVKCNGANSEGFPVRDETAKEKIYALLEEIPECRYTYHIGQVDQVLLRLEQGSVDGEEGKAGRLALEVITAIYQSGLTGHNVRLPLSRESPFYTKDGILTHVRKFNEKGFAASIGAAIEGNE